MSEVTKKNFQHYNEANLVGGKNTDFLILFCGGFACSVISDDVHIEKPLFFLCSVVILNSNTRTINDASVDTRWEEVGVETVALSLQFLMTPSPVVWFLCLIMWASVYVCSV